MPSDTANPLGGAIQKLHFTRLMYTFQVFEDVTMLFSQLFLQQPTHAVLQVLQWPWLHLRLSFQTEACLAAGGQHNGTHRHEAEDVPVRQRCGTSSTAAPLLLPKVSPRASHRATATSRARPGLRLRLRARRSFGRPLKDVKSGIPNTVRCASERCVGFHRPGTLKE